MEPLTETLRRFPGLTRAAVFDLLHDRPVVEPVQGRLPFEAAPKVEAKAKVEAKPKAKVEAKPKVEAIEVAPAAAVVAPQVVLPKATVGKLMMYSDGACRGNPGPSSIGVVLLDEAGEVVEEISRTIGRHTNNHAEYEAIRAGLERAAELGATSVHVRADSQLAVRQLMGQYRVKNEKLRPLFEAVKALEDEFPRGVRYEHVRREYNTRADALANEALDSA